MSTVLRASSLLALVACTGDGTGKNDLLAPIVADTPVSVEVAGGTLGGDPIVAVRLVNTYQAAIPGTTATLSYANAATGTEDVDLSATGVALVVPDVAGAGAVEVGVSASEDGADTTATTVAWSLPSGLPGVQMSPTAALPEVEGDPAHAATASGGIAFAAGQRVWFQSSEPGNAAFPVARMGFDIAGLHSAHVDSDGLLDLVVWGGNELVLLRGLGPAGFGWEGGWRAKEGDIVGVRATDLDGDTLTDLAIGVDRNESGVVHVAFGDGTWGWTLAEPLELTHEIWGLTASDEDGDDQPEVSVLSSARGTIRRHTLTDRGWVGASDFELTGYEAAAGATLLGQVDINGDGQEEIVIQGAPDSSAQDFVFYTLSGTPTHYPLTFGAYHAALWDLDLDGAVDMIAAEDGELHIVRYDGEGFVNEGWTGIREAGPVAAGPFTGDELPAIAVVNDAVTFHRGARGGGDASWQRDRFEWRAYNTALIGPVVVSDVSGDGVGDIVGFTTDPDVVVAAWQLDESDDGQWQVLLGGKVALDGGDPLGLVRCDDDWFALTGPPENATLSRIRLERNGSTWRPSVVSNVAAAGELLACGRIDTGEAGVVVATTTGFWTSYAANLAPRNTGDVGETGAVALGDTDGDGFPEVHGCGAAGCSVAASDLDGDGIDEVVTSTDVITVRRASGDEVRPGSGLLTLADVDGDGDLDILANDAARGRVHVVLSAASAASWTAGWQTERSLAGPAAWVDMDGDGVPEIVAADVDGRVLHTGPTAVGRSGW